mgnify:CR=1 FL=1
MVVAKTASTAVQKKTADKDGCAEVRQVKGANILAYVIAFSVTILLHSVKVCVCVYVYPSKPRADCALSRPINSKAFDRFC